MKKILVPMLAVFAAGSVLLSAGQVLAQSEDAPHQRIVQKIAQRFGLNESDVKQVFDEEKKDRQSEIRVRINERLDQAVKNGEITEAQKQLILAKRQELQAKHEADMVRLKGLTPDQRKQTRLAEMNDFKDWATKNGLDQKFLFGPFSGHGFRPKW